ncbi:MAG: zinc ribbon domain-containing protein [Candidatus Micrarchaeota archaeon]|nr:zinc ribbon domain-containing protein [Candidatus Micrarchaeota archaeon]
MVSNTILYGLANIFIGVLLYAAFSTYVPGYLLEMGMPCTSGEGLTCSAFLGIAETVSLIISVVGLGQLVYWAIFERGKDVSVSVSSSIDARARTEPPPRGFRICPECNLANDTTAKFCKECGAQLVKKEGRSGAANAK